ncbi:unnamed protein product, partial [Polarella glacialis]
AFYSSAVLIRLPALAEFVASAPRAALGHELCGLAFCSFAWRTGGGLTTAAATVAEAGCRRWTFFSRDGGTALCIATFALQQVFGEEAYDASQEERRWALALRRSAGSWASDTLSAADFVRLLAAARFAAEALALRSTFDQEAPASPSLPELWQPLGAAFGIGAEGISWLEKQAPSLVAEARERLGEPHEPESRIGDLLRTGKPSSASASSSK